MLHECKKCKVEKDESSFYKKKNGKIDGYVCKTCRNKISSEWFKTNKERARQIKKIWLGKNPERRKLHQKKGNLKARIRNKMLVINHYSNGTNKCICCNEKCLVFLTIDHINNDGKESRKKNGNGTHYYHYLIKNNYPDGYQVLCFNCNCGRQVNGGVCPHNNLLEEDIICYK